MNWYDYVAEFTMNNRHIDYPNWMVSGVWEFERSDGLRTAHHTESPFGGPGTKRNACEESMKLADQHIPLGAELPEGMRSRSDPDYGPLWDLEDEE